MLALGHHVQRLCDARKRNSLRFCQRQDVLVFGQLHVLLGGPHAQVGVFGDPFLPIAGLNLQLGLPKRFAGRDGRFQGRPHPFDDVLAMLFDLCGQLVKRRTLAHVFLRCGRFRISESNAAVVRSVHRRQLVESKLEPLTAMVYYFRTPAFRSRAVAAS